MNFLLNRLQDDFYGYQVRIFYFLRVLIDAMQFAIPFGSDKNFLHEDDLKNIKVFGFFCLIYSHYEVFKNQNELSFIKVQSLLTC